MDGGESDQNHLAVRVFPVMIAPDGPVSIAIIWYDYLCAESMRILPIHLRFVSWEKK